jgi:hypothetical protein
MRERRAFTVVAESALPASARPIDVRYVFNVKTTDGGEFDRSRYGDPAVTGQLMACLSLSCAFASTCRSTSSAGRGVGTWLCSSGMFS